MSVGTMERYGVNRQFHFSVLGRTINAGDVIELHQGNVIMRINGGQVGSGLNMAQIAEAIRVVVELAKVNPELIERLPEIDTSNAPATQTITAFPVIGCLRAAEEWLGQPLEWNTVNDDQEEFMDLFYNLGMDAADSIPELERMANANIGPINEWLEERGFDVRLTVDPGPYGFAVASILDVLVEWLKKGDRRDITNEKGTFSGVHLTQEKGVGILQNAHVHNHPVARIATKSGDKVYMTPVDGLPTGRFAIESKIRSIMVGLEAPDYRYEGVVFPMVDYDSIIDASYLHAMNTDVPAPGFFVAQAVQQTKFRMNDEGARVESACAMTLCFKSAVETTPPLVIDQPFLLWIMREGVSMPLFGGIFAEDVWNDPKTLS